MKKNNFHKFNIFLLIILFLFFFFSFSLVEAQEGTTFTPQTTIPGSKFEAGQALEISGSSFVDYLVSFYQWAVGAIAILAVIMIMVAGFQWMAASGNATSISKAKGRISNSLVGLLLAVGAYSLLNFINPSLVNLRTLNIGEIEGAELVDSETYAKNCSELTLEECQSGLYYNCEVIDGNCVSAVLCGIQSWMKESNQNSWWNKLECCRSAEDWYLQNNGIYGYKYIYTELSYGLSCSEVCGEEWLALVDNYKCQDFFCNQKITSCSDCMEKFPEASEACCLMANHKCALDCVWQHEEEEGSICASP